MNTHVSFDIAKLLRSKGFRELTPYYYSEEDHFYKGELISPKGTLIQNEDWPYNACTESLHAPTLADVVMWLYEKHGIWVSVDKQNYKLFKCSISNINVSNDAFTDNIVKSFWNFDSPTAAYEAAFAHILNNIICV